MAWDWKSYMEGRLQDREIRKYMDRASDQIASLDSRATTLESRVSDLEGYAVNNAYGGMRFTTGSTTPVPGTIGLTPVKITLYDEEMPLFGSPVNVSFDSANDEVVIATGQGGVYEVTLYVNFEGEQGELYSFNVYLDGASIGNTVYARVSQADNVEELQLTTIARINGDGRWSIWVNADKENTTFNVFGTSLYFTRAGIQMADA